MSLFGKRSEYQLSRHAGGWLASLTIEQRHSSEGISAWGATADEAIRSVDFIEAQISERQRVNQCNCPLRRPGVF